MDNSLQKLKNFEHDPMVESKVCTFEPVLELYRWYRLTGRHRRGLAIPR